MNVESDGENAKLTIGDKLTADIENIKVGETPSSRTRPPSAARPRAASRSSAFTNRYSSLTVTLPPAGIPRARRWQMISPMIVGLVGGAFAARLMVRRAWRRRQARLRGRWAAPRHEDAAQRLAARVARLELNQRQREDLEETFAVIREQTGLASVAEWPALERAFAAIKGEELDVDSLRGQPEKILDALEHLHNILTPEQRAAI